MEFRWINKQGVESDSGFVVQRTGRFTCEYREADQTIEIGVESCISGGRPSISINQNAFAKWGATHASHEAPLEEQERLMKNFKDAMAFKGYVVEVCP